MDMSGGAACCRSASDCTILETKEKLAAQVLHVALLYNLSGFTMQAHIQAVLTTAKFPSKCLKDGFWLRDWEFGESFYWEGFNETMAYVAGVLRPHNIGLGLSINSDCEAGSGSSSDPSCDPAYHDTPWAAILTDMGTYEIGDEPADWA